MLPAKAQGLSTELSLSLEGMALPGGSSIKQPIMVLPGPHVCFSVHTTLLPYVFAIINLTLRFFAIIVRPWSLFDVNNVVEFSLFGARSSFFLLQAHCKLLPASHSTN